MNLRPHGPEPCALAKLSYAPVFDIDWLIVTIHWILSIGVGDRQAIAGNWR